jgi:hypothetical protein
MFADREAFVMEHQPCGDLTADVVRADGRVIACTSLARAARRSRAGSRRRPPHAISSLLPARDRQEFPGHGAGGKSLA